MTRNCRAYDTATWHHGPAWNGVSSAGSQRHGRPQTAASVASPNCSEAQSTEAAVTEGAEQGVSGGLDVLAVTSPHSPGASAEAGPWFTCFTPSSRYSKCLRR